MENYWEEAAATIEEVYGGVVDYDERFFVCPECGEPIYEDDWRSYHFISCPVCGFEFEDDEDNDLNIEVDEDKGTFSFTCSWIMEEKDE